jgi:DNA polymerase/3'-5' exonuclease PolX
MRTGDIEKGQKSSYGYIAYQIAQLKKPVSSMMQNLSMIKGIGPTTKAMIPNIIHTGTTQLYQDRLNGKTTSK